MRIVSLLPSATDIVAALGGSADLVGVSHSCGPAFAHLPAVTSTTVDTEASAAAIDAQVKEAAAPLYRLDTDLLAHLAPGVIVSQSLCDVCAVASGDVEAAIAALPSRPTLVNLAPFRLDDVPLGISDVGAAIGRTVEAERLLAEWEAALARFEAVGRARTARPRVAFLDWLDPPFAAGHWLPDMIQLLGCDSVLAEPGQPSHEISWDAVRRARPNIVIAAACGQTAARAGREAAMADPSLILLNGDTHFSRPGPALLESLAVLDRTLAARGL